MDTTTVMQIRVKQFSGRLDSSSPAFLRLREPLIDQFDALRILYRRSPLSRPPEIVRMGMRSRTISVAAYCTYSERSRSARRRKFSKPRST